jgi:hypothetical protein
MTGSPGSVEGLNPQHYVFVPEDLADPNSVVFGGVHFQDWERKEMYGLVLPVSHFGYAQEPHDLSNVDLVNVSLDHLLEALSKAERYDMGIFLVGIERGLGVRGNAFQRNWSIGFLAVAGKIREKEDRNENNGDKTTS